MVVGLHSPSGKWIQITSKRLLLQKPMFQGLFEVYEARRNVKLKEDVVNEDTNGTQIALI